MHHDLQICCSGHKLMALCIRTEFQDLILFPSASNACDGRTLVNYIATWMTGWVGNWMYGWMIGWMDG